jgi:hypothetical protein
MAWLDKPVDPDREPDPDSLVELTRLGSRIDAEALVRELSLLGIDARLFSADADGVAPHYGLLTGHRVMVRARDRAAAIAALVPESGD